MVNRSSVPALFICACLALPPDHAGSASAQTQDDRQSPIKRDAQTLPTNDHAVDCPTTAKKEAACHADEVSFTQPTGANGKISQVARRIDVDSFGPGLSFGNMGGWRVNKIDVDFFNIANRGIAQAHSLFLNKHAVGDTMGSYSYVYSDGGSTALSDESIKGNAVDMGETTGYFHGTIAATSGKGDLRPSLTFVSGNNWTTDGAPLLDISKGSIAGQIVGQRTAIPGTGLSIMPVDNTLPATAAWGVCRNEVPNNNLVQKNQPFTCTVDLKLGSFTSAGTVCISGPNYPEQAQITAASPPDGGTQTITIKPRNPNGPGANIFQGGVCGQYISFDANLAVSGYRSSYYAFGATDAHHLIFGYNLKGQVVSDLPLASEAERFGVTGRNGYHLYPGCEIVTNLSMQADPVCEPNSVAWAVDDVVEVPHNVAVNTVGHFVDLIQHTPANGSLSSGDLVQFRGVGAVGRNFIARRTVNLNPYNIFVRYGGALDAPDMERIEGYFATGFSFNAAPGTLIRIAGNADHSKEPMTLFSLPGGEIRWDPATSTLLVPRIQTEVLRGTTGPIGGAPLPLGSCASGAVTIPGATSAMVPTAVAETVGAPGFSPQGGFQVAAQVTAPDQVTINVCSVIAGTPKPSKYIVALQ